MKNPEAPKRISYSDGVLTWNAASDKPDCSGIDYYVIYKEGNFFGTSFDTRYNLELSNGDYFFEIIAVDKAQNVGDVGSKTLSVSSSSSSGGTSSGGGGTGLLSSPSADDLSEENATTTTDSDAAESDDACVPDWQCTEWSKCSSEGKQLRACQDANDCDSLLDKPSEEQDCDNVEESAMGLAGAGDMNVTDENKAGSNRITGAVIGNLISSQGAVIVTIALIVIIIGSLVYVRHTKRPRT